VREEVNKKTNFEGLGLLSKGIKFLKEVKIEAKKITWASKKQTLLTSLMVIFLSLFIGAYLGLLDVIYNFIIGILVR